MGNQSFDLGLGFSCVGLWSFLSLGEVELVREFENFGSFG